MNALIVSLTADDIPWEPVPVERPDVPDLGQVLDRLQGLSQREIANWILDLVHNELQCREALHACLDALHRELRRRHE